MMDFKQFDSDDEDVDMSSDNETDTEDESESDTEVPINDNQDLLEIINDIKSTFNYSLQLRKKFREKIEDMEEYDQNEWRKILKSYAKLEAAVKEETDGLDSSDKEEAEEAEEQEEEKDEEEAKDGEKDEDFWDFIYEFKHILTEKDLKRFRKYFVKAAEKKDESNYVEPDEGVEDDPNEILEKVDELNEDFHVEGSDCFNHCSDEKIKCLGHAVDSLLRYGSSVMNPEKLKFIQELIKPYHETVRKIANPKVSTHEKRKLLQKAQVGEGVLKFFNLARANHPVGWKPSSRMR